MRLRRSGHFLIALTTALALAAIPTVATASPGAVSWQTGIRAVGNGATVEPAVNDVTGTQTFLITPNNSPFWDSSAHPGTPVPANLLNTSAPLYLVTYPKDSTVDTASPLNCYTEGAFDSTLPYNCDHAQIPGVKGHDHLVGVPGSKKSPVGGDFNVAWHVVATVFTKQGIDDLAMNTRILTLAQLEAAQQRKDVSPAFDTGIYFNCSVVASPVYMNGTALTFPPF